MKKKIFVIGDSISIQYGPYLQKALAADFDYARKGGEEEALRNLDIACGANGGDSTMVRSYLESLTGCAEFCPDILLVNCGLHDIKIDAETAAHQVEKDEYRSNLKAIVNLGQRLAEHVVWVETTPVDDEMHRARKCGFERMQADVIVYNRIADEVMAQAGVPVIALGAFTARLGSGAEIYSDGVHFLPSVQQQQAAFIAGWYNGYCR